MPHNFLKSSFAFFISVCLLSAACTTAVPEEPARQVKDRPCPGDPCFNPSLARQKVSGYNGARFGMVRSGGAKRHSGLDLLMPTESDLFAMFDSYVYSIESRTGWGECIILLGSSHGQQVFVMYAHLDHSVVPLGSIVEAGDKVAISGNSGNLKEAREEGYVQSHMHLEIRAFEPGKNFIECQALDPEEFMYTKLTYSGDPVFDLPCHNR